MKEQSKPNSIQMNFVLWICQSKNMSLSVTGSAADYHTNNDDATSLMVD